MNYFYIQNMDESQKSILSKNSQTQKIICTYMKFRIDIIHCVRSQSSADSWVVHTDWGPGNVLCCDLVGAHLGVRCKTLSAVHLRCVYFSVCKLYFRRVKTLKYIIFACNAITTKPD